MKTFIRSLLAISLVLLSGLPVLAATGSRQDHSSAVVWGFLGFCALIVIAQLLPAIRNARQVAQVERERKAQVNLLRGTLDK